MQNLLGKNMGHFFVTSHLDKHYHLWYLFLNWIISVYWKTFYFLLKTSSTYNTVFLHDFQIKQKDADFH